MKLIQIETRIKSGKSWPRKKRRNFKKCSVMVALATWWTFGLPGGQLRYISIFGMLLDLTQWKGNSSYPHEIYLLCIFSEISPGGGSWKSCDITASRHKTWHRRIPQTISCQYVMQFSSSMNSQSYYLINLSLSGNLKLVEINSYAKIYHNKV